MTPSTVSAPLRLPAVALLAMLLGNPLQATEAAPPDDHAIVGAVTEEILLDQGVDAVDLQVAAEDGVITLTGTVDNLLARERAGTLATTVRGVRAVVNRIAVVPPLVSDRALRHEVIGQLALNPATDSYEIAVSAEGGIVSLAGTVDSWQEMQLAGRVAKGVAGVRGLRNRITVDYDPLREDRQIAADVRQALRWDALVDHALITVEVEEARVGLSGVVGSLAEKRRARDLARVTGVAEVSVAGLDVERWARDPALREGKHLPRPDEEVAAALRAALARDPRVDAGAVTLRVDGHLVTLSGTVGDLQARRAAAADARSTVGVWRVRNHLRVVPGEARPDAEIARDLREALRRDPYVGGAEIEVAVSDGRVRLSGAVDTSFEKARADDVAAAVTGVKAVRNRLQVDGIPRARALDPYVDDGRSAYDYDWYTYYEQVGTRLADWEIREAIEEQLAWSPYVNEERITVTVDGGVATLTGSVGSITAQLAATENAYDGGAVAVRNRLEVEPGGGR